ncbi:MAG: DUF3291 domain-containing protein [Alphaproteobacteria bacterium]|nr:DUF3291 domain-containing protein [Alphaproteobacteria bacterium]
MIRTLSMSSLIVLLSGCALAAPFEGPGYDMSEGLLIEADGPLIAVVTHARHAKGKGKEFDAHVDAIVEQLEASPGYVGKSLRGEIGGRDAWTLSVWEDEASVSGFMAQGAHLDAVNASSEITELLRAARFEIAPEEMPPDWGEALDILDEQSPME